MLLVRGGDDVHGDVPRERVMLELIQDHPAVHVGQPEIQRDRVRAQHTRHLQAVRPRRRDDAAEPVFAREAQQGATERLVILDHQQHAIPGFDRVAIVRGVIRHGRQRLRPRRRVPSLAATARGDAQPLGRRLDRRRQADARRVVERDEQRQRAAHARLAVEL